MSECTGVPVSTRAKVNRTRTEDVWEIITTFTTISGDITCAAAIPLNGILQKIIVTLPDMALAEDTTDVSLTDNGDNTIWSVTNLVQSATYAYSVNEPFAREVNIVLGFTDPQTEVIPIVTLRGI